MSDEIDITSENNMESIMNQESSAADDFSVQEPLITVNEPSKKENSHKSEKMKGENWFKKHSGFIVFIIVLLVAVACVIFSLTSSSGRNNSPKNIFDESKTIINVFNKKEDKGGVGTFRKEYIAVLKIEGTIEHENQTYDQEWLLSTL